MSNLWAARRHEERKAACATRLQAWWRGILAVRARAVLRKATAAIPGAVRRSVYAAIAAGACCPPPPPRPPAPDSDEEVLREAISEAQGEAAALGASLLPIVLGLGRG